MPTYVYQVINEDGSEGETFEVFQKMSDDPVAECPECGEAAKRMISGGAGFLFKGDGFYITDYRSDDYKKKASADKGESKGESSSSGSSSSSDGSGDSSGSSSSPSSE